MRTAASRGPAAEYSPDPPKDCPLCPRLAEFRRAAAQENPDWFNGAVPSFGDETGRLMIVGLAPGLQGANRTGRPFTGDYAGDLLYATLRKFGFSTGDYARRPDDGLLLQDALISNAVRCVPPENKPTGGEIAACRPFLRRRIETMPNLQAIICLGRIAHESTVRALGGLPKSYPFAHGARHEGLAEGISLFDSYHCSRYNTNTGRLTARMFELVFEQAGRVLRKT